MKRILSALLFILLAGNVQAQSLKKYAISKSGCSAYFFCDPGTFGLEKSPDSSDVYTGECQNDETAYGLICVRLREKIANLNTSEETLVAYLDYLKSSLNITSAAGYGKGHRLKNSEATRGIIDYWKDKDNDNWKIKAWTNSQYMVVMYAYSKKELNESKVNLFLDGLVLP